MPIDTTLTPWMDFLQRLYPSAGVMLVGAGSGTGSSSGNWLDCLREWSPPHVTLVEADETQFQHLQRNTRDAQGWNLHQVVVARTAGRVAFHQASHLAESGLIEPAALRGLWANLQTQHTTVQPAVTLSSLRAQHPFDWLMVDCLPALPIVEGAGADLDQVDVLLARVLLTDIPDSAEEASLQALQSWLEPRGLRLLASTVGRHPATGHALFVRDHRQALRTLAHQQQLHQQQLQLQPPPPAPVPPETEELDTLRQALTASQQAHTAAESLAAEQATLIGHLQENLRATESARQAAVALANVQHHLGDLRTQLNASESARQRGEQRLDQILQQLKEQRQEQAAVQQQLAPERVPALLLPLLAPLLEERLLKQTASQREQAKELDTHLRAELTRGLANAVKQIESFIGIQNFLAHGTDITDFHGWPISPDIGLILLGKIRARRYDLILEFGSGTSTALFARMVRATLPVPATDGTQPSPQPRIVSFEHDTRYHRKTAELLQSQGLTDLVDLQHSPLIDTRFSDAPYLYYDCTDRLQALARQHAGQRLRILVLVDGPPAKTCAHARYPALPLVLQHLGRHTVDLVLDDFHRKEEAEIVERWRQMLQARSVHFSEEILPCEKGAIVLSINSEQAEA
jgi:Methyltransferase domain